ncbi:MAG: Na(+)/H(+) antiporter subunit C [Acidimicrobiales bacterium mtb01]|nr:Na(+)/H(+) antiporter subunit C [Actinomycetota bacterium]TEX47942.1 MAG: Na(+)/H(+) antiporter subunit C [Acidimicrobiales bacterium mtb01]
MSPALLILIGVLFSVGTYLLMERSLTRVALGVGVLGNAVNLLIVAAGSRPDEAPIIGRSGDLTDPLPQALVLTAIVIGFALLSFVLALAWRNWSISENDEVEDDLEDRAIARRAEWHSKHGDAPHHEDVDQ